MVHLPSQNGEGSETSSSENESPSDSGTGSSSTSPPSSFTRKRLATACSVSETARAIASDGSEDEEEDDGDDVLERRFDRWQTTQAQGPVIPHKVLKLRRLVFEAFHCALSIVAAVQAQAPELALSRGAVPRASRPLRKGEQGAVKLDVKEPWMRLSRVVVALKGATASGLKEEEPASSSCLGG